MKKTHRTVEDFLPLSTPMYHILLTLGARRMHGYAMMEAVETRSQGRISLLPGTLYNTLAKMLDVGLISEANGAQVNDSEWLSELVMITAAELPAPKPKKKKAKKAQKKTKS